MRTKVNDSLICTVWDYHLEAIEQCFAKGFKILDLLVRHPLPTNFHVALFIIAYHFLQSKVV